MIKQRMLQRGFTLIEIIIVIVIIGILATLALPRITGQMESSRAAEAMNMFGAIRRAAVNCIDMGNASGDAAGANTAATNCLTWVQLGMTAPTAPLFTYTANNAAGVMQFRAVRGANAICMNLTASTALGQYQVTGVPYAGAVNQTGAVGGAACAAAALPTVM